jgi:RNA recognition motif-containing protein
MTEMVDTIFVTGLNEEITEDALVNHFGSIGVIKVSIVNKNGTWAHFSLLGVIFPR